MSAFPSPPCCPSCGRARQGPTAECAHCGTPPDRAVPPPPTSRPRDTPARLFIHAGPDRGIAFLLFNARTVVGRSRDADATLSDPLVSAKHFAIAPSGEGATIEDLRSANGTLFEGRPIQPGRPMIVPYGSMLEFGGTIAELVAPDAEPRDAPPTITRGPRRTTRSRWRTLALLGAIATIAVLALVVGIVALSRDNPPRSAVPPTAGSNEVRDASWIMRTQRNTALQVFACERTSESVCEATLQGGTGSVLDLDDGLILTNFHVIADEKSARPLPDLWVAVSVAGQDYVAAETVGYSACDDLAILRTVEDASALDLAEVDLGDAGTLEAGDPIVVLGYPGTVATDRSGDQQLQLTAGNVSALGVVADNYLDLVQMSAPINHGNSGGPVFDLAGTQVGVATLGDGGDTQGIFYAISIDRVKQMLPALTAGKRQTGLDSCPS